ncbi:RNA polymerase factor sigma-54 [Candidatus Sumerlaeota bacterium]|nr:RNA polymerase factor sigma-54 [Candidatus Sumerlaeota bacterium]
MPLALQQVQKLQQRLIMTPQMQQSVKLLQMNTVELDALTQAELLENPFLELEEEDVSPNTVESSDTEGADHSQSAVETANPDDSPRKTIEDEADGSYRTEPQADDAGSVEEDTAANSDRLQDNDEVSDRVESSPVEDQPEQFAEVDTDWSEVFDDDATPTYHTPRDDTEERSFEETVAVRASLYEVLERQLRTSSLDGLDAEIGRYLIGCIDENGYLQVSVEECAQRFGVAETRVERVLGIVQDFEPTGVGARDLPECLILQLAAMNELTIEAKEILTEHWPLMLRKKFKEIARIVETDEQTVAGLFNRIGRLDPSPGRSYSKERPIYVTPDVYVKQIDGRYFCYLHEGQVAHLRLNNVYKEILLGDKREQDPKEREYALDKYRAAVMFIKNIEKRRNTILRVTEAIMEYQHEFLQKGVSALRPLALSEIADRVGMHESTISRVTSAKYVDTPQGMFELKFFFSSAIESSSGEAASSRAVKQKIQGIVAGEDPRKPLSDDRIAKILKSQGFTIARRTVAKYREQLRILPTNLRRQS